MKFLRRISTRRLVFLCVVTAAAVIGVAAIAMAMVGGGPKPPPKPLPEAIHDALGAPAVPGVSARVEFTNHLVSAGGIEGADPLLSGASGRLWASPAEGGELRLELQSEGGGGDTQVLVAGGRFEIYDGGTETVYRGKLPERESGEDGSGAGGAGSEQPPSLGAIEEALAKASRHANLSGAIPSDVAGQPTYTVEASPKSDGGLLGGAALAWDAENGVPLRAAVYASGDSSPVIQLQATDVSFEAVEPTVFEVSAPPGAKVVELAPEGGSQQGGEVGGKPRQLVGAAEVEAAVGFPLAAPEELAGRPRSEVRGIEVNGRAAALVTYGRGLDGLAVIESAAEPSKGEGGSSGEGGLALPKVSIDGSQGEELQTALGTAIRFSRGGVDYIVIGSVPASVAEAAARAL